MTLFPNPVASWLSSGEDFLTQGNYAQALAAFEQALGLAQQSCNPQAEVLALQRLGDAHLGQGQPTLSVASIQQAIAIALEQHNFNALYECHRQLAQAYKSMHSFELALHHLEAADGLRDSCDRPAAPTAANVGPDPLDWAVCSALAEQNKDSVLVLFRSMVEQANFGVAIFQDERLVYGNPCLMQWAGCDPQDLGRLTMADLIALAPEPRSAVLDDVGPQEGQLLGQQGQVLAVEIYATTLVYRDSRSVPEPTRNEYPFGNRPALVTYLRDISAARCMEDRLRASEARYRSLIHHVPIGLCRFSPEGRPLDANPALLAIFGFSDVATFLDASPLQPSSPVINQGQPLLWSDYLNLPNPLKDCEIKLSHPDGRYLWVRVVARAVREATPSEVADSNGAIQFYEGAVEDITEIKAAQLALEELAVRDSLTHVYNRRHFIDLASREIVRSARFNRPVTLLMLDIDHFKAINDTYGHLVGDAVLRDIALRLKANLRQSDILARYGGEEFILLMPETDQAQAWIGAERLRRVIAATPFDSDGGPLSVTASVGLSCWPASADSSSITSLPHINDLISKADQALYRAKHSGRNQTQAEAWLYSVNSQIA
ncbi:diguanylate cyclase [Leptolyngbya sp. CCNP1308]|uniref:diguanylate cyclase n=1 Tax=Leptolyngbya sp. CCNP1308 TaxID=3110255 RepID=UPI002B20EF6B|nr:diguanylate cyclase [Leptolyngbya sp. CCNP1308]MEA5451024.1 diguanylate cyclase [Leptolyngbya sp. CCNP1308]